MAGIVNPTSLLLEPEKMLRCFDDNKFEAMIRDWQSTFIGTKYKRVEKLAGSNDKGRDVACTDLNDGLHIFQCKNYEKALNLSDVLPEVAKCCYYCFKGIIPIPNEYRFMSPLGVTNKVADLFRTPEELKLKLKTNWTNMCQTKICSEAIILISDLSSFIDKMDFSIFNYISPDEFLRDFEKTPFFSKYFLQIVKPRPLTRLVPEEIENRELTYIKKLLSAYSDYLKKNIEDRKKLQELYPNLYEDFKRQRQYFFSAECLAEYSREVYPPESQWFDQLKDEFFDGIIDEVEADCQHGFERLRKVLKRAMELKIGSGQLLDSVIRVQDRKGICHHLANERDEITWVKK